MDWQPSNFVHFSTWTIVCFSCHSLGCPTSCDHRLLSLFNRSLSNCSHQSDMAGHTNIRCDGRTWWLHDVLSNRRQSSCVFQKEEVACCVFSSIRIMVWQPCLRFLHDCHSRRVWLENAVRVLGMYWFIDDFHGCAVSASTRATCFC